MAEIDVDKLNEAMARVQEGRLAALTGNPPTIPLPGSDIPEVVDEPTILSSNPDIHSVIDQPDPLPDEPVLPVEPVEPPPPATVSISGRDYPLEDIESLIQFNDLLSTNPALFARIQDAVRSPLTQPYNPNVQQIPLTPEPTVEPPKFTLPEDLDLEDPNTKFMVESFQYMQDRQRELEARSAQFDQFLNQQQTQFIEQSISTGRAEFQAANPDLTAADLARLEEEIGRTQLLAGLRQANPNLDLAAATKEAFERSMWAVPEIRDRLLHAKDIISLEQEREDRVRQSKLSALSGTSSSTPRVPAPATPADRKQQMINELATAMGQRTQSN